MGIKLAKYSSLLNRWEPGFYFNEPKESPYEITKMLSELCDVVPDSRKVKRDQQAKYNMFVDGSCVNKDSGLIKQLKEVSSETSKRLRYRAEEGDILIPLIEAKSFIPTVINLSKEKNVLVSDTFAVIAPKVDVYYLYWALSTDFVKNQVEARRKGTVIKRLSIADLKEIELPWLQEEKRKEKIQMIKGQFTIDEKVDLQEKINTVFKESFNIEEPPVSKQNLYLLPNNKLTESETWMVSSLNPNIDRFLEKIKVSTNARTIEDVSKVVSIGFNPSKHRKGDKLYKIVKSKNLGVLAIKGEFETVEVSKELTDTELLQENDVLYRVKGEVGPATVVDGSLNRVLFHDHIALIRVNPEKIIPKYLAIILNSYLVHKQVERYVASSSTRYLSISDLKKLIIPIPCLDIQAEMVSKVF